MSDSLLVIGIAIGVVVGLALAAGVVYVTVDSTWSGNCIIDKTLVATDLSTNELHEIASWVQSKYPNNAVYSNTFPEQRIVCCCPNVSGWDQVCCAAGGL